MKRPSVVPAALLAAAALLCAAGPARAEDPLGLPESVSEIGDQVDHLTYLITWVVGVTFVLVQGALVWFLVAYRRKPGVRAKHTHGNHTVEMVWTIVPAVVLVFLAVYQMGLWGEMKAAAPKDADPTDPKAVRVQIFAKRFEWNFRYPGADGKYGTPDDPVTLGNLVVPVNRPVLAELRSMDVIHSFFLPNLRFKTDAVPGLTAKLWFRPNKLSKDRAPVRDRNGNLCNVAYYDVVCAELCGDNHSVMAGRLYVVSDEDYEKFLKGEATSLGDEIGKPIQVDLANPTGAYDRIWAMWAHQDDLVPAGPPRWKRFPFGEDDKGPVEEDDL